MLEGLPNDLIRLLMFQYFDTGDAIRFLRVSKRFYESVGDVERFLEYCVTKECGCKSLNCSLLIKKRCCKLSPPFFDSCSFEACEKKLIHHQKTCSARVCKWCQKTVIGNTMNHTDPYHPSACKFAKQALRLW